MKKKSRVKKILNFIVFQFLFIIITGPFLIFYGPFNNVKKHVVGGAMTTLTHKYIAKIFLSQSQIEKILMDNEIIIHNQKQLDKITNNIKNTTYEPKVNIKRYDIKSKRFKGYALLVNNPKKVKVGYSSKLGEVGETTSKIASNYKAIAAVNGGGFQYNKQNNAWISKGSNPVGFLICDGKIIYKGDAKEEKIDTVAFTKDGVLLVGKYSLKELMDKKVEQCISFGPALVINGKGTITKGDGGWGIAPRTVIGQKKDGTVILLVVDGRQTSSYGATLKDLENIMIKLGAYNAVNLDGGSSSAMFFNGNIINNPCDPLGERVVPSIIYVEP